MNSYPTMANTPKAFFQVISFLFTIVLPLHASHAQINSPVEAIYQFGDSISDTGNLIRIRGGERSKCGMPPYGVSNHNNPTGRCSDGLLMIDYIAGKFFKSPSLDPYLNKKGNFIHGANFAVVGSTAISTSNGSLSDQLEWFRSFCSPVCRSKLAKALFIIESGGNDFNSAFFQMKSLQDMQDVYKKVPQVVGAVAKAVEDVIKFGATRVVVAGNFPIGCLPIYLTKFQTNDATKYDEHHCLKELNQFATSQNTKLQESLSAIQKKNPNAKIVYADYYTALTQLLQKATALGFDKDGTQKVCCGTGDKVYNFDSTRMCGTKGVLACQDPSKRVSWDGIHMTQHAYQIMASWLLEHNIVPAISKATN